MYVLQKPILKPRSNKAQNSLTTKPTEEEAVDTYLESPLYFLLDEITPQQSVTMPLNAANVPVPELMDIEENREPSPTESSNNEVAMEEDEEGSARSEATFRHTVEGVSRLRDGQVLSPPCYVRNLPWKIMVMSRPEQIARHPCSLGFFLQCNGDADSSSWNCSAVATLKLIPQKSGCEPFSRKISHIFHAKENDWGYSNFMEWHSLIDPNKGFIKNDSIILEVDVKADAPHGVAWDSKKHTGFVGLKNQGATCYMNSLLQTLFFTNKLRKAVYKMPTESDDSTKSVALALQRVFYELQTSDKPVGTKKLTRSFGWETLDSFMQHDVQEFLRVLLDKLESKMKSTCVEGTIQNLFEGKMISFVKCKHVKYESSRSETYYDIQLNIKDKKSIYESFKNYVSTETLCGDNKYDAGSHGLQEAEKGVIFTSFPPVLHLHLMRFQYDPVTDCSVKSNDRFEFSEKINLDEFLEKSDQKTSEPADYTLHAVLVHSGDNHGGHYVVFINPRGDGKWCKFDDDVVSRCTKQEAIQHNFGGQEMDDIHPGVKQSTNAYMLVYIRDSEMNSVLEEVTEDDIPRELLERLKEEKNIEFIKRKERSEAHLYTTVNVMTEDAFIGHQASDLYDPEKMTPAAIANTRNFKVLKKAKPMEFIKILTESYKVDEKRIRLWLFSTRTSKTSRPIYFDIHSDPNKPLEDLLIGSQMTFFLEMLPPEDERDSLPPFHKERDVLLFLKMYDPITECLHYMGHWTPPILTKLSELAAECRRRANLPENSMIELYDEVNNGYIDRISNVDTSLEEGLEELLDGDIIVFYKVLSESPNGKKLKTVCDFYSYLQFKYEFTFIDKSNNTEPFTIELSLKSTYMEMATLVAQRLGCKPLNIQFFKNIPYRDSVGTPIKYDGDSTDLMTLQVAPNHKTSRTPHKLFYQILSIPVSELEHKKPYKLYFYSHEDQEREYVFYVNKAPKILIKDVLSELAKVLWEDEEPRHKLRLVEVFGHKINQIYDEETSADTITSYPCSEKKYHRAEEILPEEMELGPNDALAPVAHFHKDARSTFGVPFLVKVQLGESWGSIKSKIQRRLGISEKDWSKMRVAIVAQSNQEFMEKDHDGTPLKSEIFNSFKQLKSAWIGVEHVNKAIKRSRYSTLEKAIKIYN